MNLLADTAPVNIRARAEPKRIKKPEPTSELSLGKRLPIDLNTFITSRLHPAIREGYSDFGSNVRVLQVEDSSDEVRSCAMPILHQYEAQRYDASSSERRRRRGAK